MFANKMHEKGHDFLKSGELDKALECYKQALTEHPNNPDIYSDRGVVYLHKKQQVEAMKDFNKALELQPEYGFRYAARAYARDFFGDTEGAISDYERAIELDPEDAVSYNNLGMLQEKLGFNKKAKENFERADRLSKMENDLYRVMDELEQADEAETASNESKPEDHHMIDPETIREQNISSYKEFSSIFTSKKQFKEFIRFIRNGFRIK